MKYSFINWSPAHDLFLFKDRITFSISSLVICLSNSSKLESHDSKLLFWQNSSVERVDYIIATGYYV